MATSGGRGCLQESVGRAESLRSESSVTEDPWYCLRGVRLSQKLFVQLEYRAASQPLFSAAQCKSNCYEAFYSCISALEQFMNCMHGQFLKVATSQILYTCMHYVPCVLHVIVY